MRTTTHLTYARPSDTLVRRLAIRSMEELSGRRRLARLYAVWQRHLASGDVPAFGMMLDLMRISLRIEGRLPDPATLPERLVMVANHPFGIGDGVALLALAEQLGRPFRILINADLMKIPEMAAYGLPVSFEETREAMAANMATRVESMRLLAEGTTIVVFPAGGVATAPKIFGEAADLPWKQFTARLIRSGGAAVLPIHVHGQNGPLFHLVSRWSMTLRVGLLIGEFRRRYGRSIDLSIGPLITSGELSGIGDRRLLTERLRQAVFSLARPAAQPQSAFEPIAA
ncbi:1-acyl-sn-glycerol-3-phosphate acyltransferase [Aurantimonas coralicida]|uniref:1-acyl-sn-glycerol-3-phosphate acyltransferase n=1 Tax=Aurantimonas coralicida TaxID=182270 RepID=UPI002389E6A5|nr:1-acyl-sn-glycerol-3-phosphate acyltransferase [Aurantimonas coralicida]MDE0923675.1 1-acyl-sn-glycerol-3-phosphate acyltransferase [Aurantimonas coralicida]